jgi:hypothetical protein
VLYHDIEGFARAADLWEPMYVGPTVRFGQDLPGRLRRIGDILSVGRDIRPMCVVATFAMAQWPRDRIEERLDELMAACRDTGLPAEIHLNTWWAGTPLGFDGHGGRWTDPEYQQVTYDPDARVFGLSVPNRWSNTPWLTTRHPRLNAFKIGRFELAGRILRGRWKEAAESGRGELPIAGLVLDNEVTYWAAGMPDMPRNLQADFNPAMVEAARRENVELDPEDGLSTDETAFLRRSLRTYNRAMASGLMRGLAESPLGERVRTHTWVRGFGFENAAQALDAGLLQGVRLGAECNYSSSADLAVMDRARETGVPVMLNVELGHQESASDEVPFAFAAGCRRVSLFNASDALLRATAELIAEGWPEYRPVPWRPRVLRLDFEPGCRWSEFVELDGAEVGEICPVTRNGIQAGEIEKPGRALIRLNSRALTGQERFGRLALAYRMRAFVWKSVNDDAYLAIRAGRSRDSLEEVERRANCNGRFCTDLTAIAADARDVYVEFELHALVLKGWVALFDLDIEIPWEEEKLLFPNRSYRADRLRAEGLVAGWRGDAEWQLDRLRRLVPSVPEEVVRDLEQSLARGQYREVSERAAEIRRSRVRVEAAPPKLEPSDGEWRGEMARLSEDAVGFHPYTSGVLNRVIPRTAGAEIVVYENDAPVDSAAMAGDDLRIVVRGGHAVRVEARRGRRTARIARYAPATPFALPVLEWEDGESRKICSRARVEGRDGIERRGTTWLRVGDEPFVAGDRVRARWNPHTGRIVEAVFEGD